MNKRLLRTRSCSGLLSLLLIISLLTGCWSSYEINKLAIITMLGIDLDASGNFHVSALIVQPVVSSGGMQGTGRMEPPVLVATSTGKGLYDSIRKLSSALPKKIYWSHLQAIIVGQEAAKEKMVPALDIMLRQHEFRNNIELLVTKGKASEIIALKPNLQGSMGAEVRGIIRLSQKTAMTLVNDVAHFAQDMSSETRDHITGEISPSIEKGVEIRKNNEKTPAVSIRGAAVFRQNRFAGWMNKEETRGVLFLLDKVKGGIVEIPCTKNEAGTVNLQFTKVLSRKSPKIVNGSLEMDVTINANAEIDEITCPGIHLNSKQIEIWNGLLEQEIRKNIDKALQKGQKEWGADIFQFGDVIYKKYPREWDRLKLDWREDGLKNMKVHVKISAAIGRYGLITDPLQTDESR
ncbi:Ger(x)C family spore germination protein [Paenibacillus piri]|uniref:Ger(X)C family spore germination protein n=1 Tax=Paenibacillus piri TaxID=2547395 RepID=A0A4R5KQE3_9BACL|nr:Ger(x)C family spore germination protein [Paenibacillus piri]TDF97973.1 Ger(x)C family spore germination protein [Paenibacillus piri]